MFQVTSRYDAEGNAEGVAGDVQLATTCPIFRAISSASCPRSRRFRRTTNSSPPMRHTVSESLIWRVSRCATSCSKRSPISRPGAVDLLETIEIEKQQGERLVGPAGKGTWPDRTTTRRSPRLARLVKALWLARWCNRTSARFRRATSR